MRVIEERTPDGVPVQLLNAPGESDVHLAPDIQLFLARDAIERAWKAARATDPREAMRGIAGASEAATWAFVLHTAPETASRYKKVLGRKGGAGRKAESAAAKEYAIAFRQDNMHLSQWRVANTLATDPMVTRVTSNPQTIEKWLKGSGRKESTRKGR